ncbi:hypothetical protein FF1_032957 [Malus domestica]
MSNPTRVRSIIGSKSKTLTCFKPWDFRRCTFLYVDEPPTLGLGFARVEASGRVGAEREEVSQMKVCHYWIRRSKPKSSCGARRRSRGMFRLSLCSFFCIPVLRRQQIPDLSSFSCASSTAFSPHSRSRNHPAAILLLEIPIVVAFVLRRLKIPESFGLRFKEFVYNLSSMTVWTS